MRSRPDLKLYLLPQNPTPGTRLRAEAELVSHSETPIDAVEFHLTGIEQRHTGTVMAGDVPVAQYATRRHVDLVARTPKATLTEGKHRFVAEFDLPADAPPAYKSATSVIHYDLLVRVAIPWWPDRSQRYVVPVVTAAERPRIAPGTYCTDARGPEGSALYLEASLESAVVPLGGVFRGAVSVANVAHHRVRRVELALVVSERGRGTGRSGSEVSRYVVTLHDGAPEEGQPLRFRLAVPPDAAPGFTGAVVEVGWHLEVRAVIALGTDVTLSVPVEIIRAGEGLAPAVGPAPRVPPVGRERRALVWAESARRGGLAVDADEERMTLDLGPHTRASLAITLEPRKEGGLQCTATVTWPRLGLDLAVTERRWVDAWSKALAFGVPGFSERFTVRGREEAQIRALLDEASCRGLLLFEEVAVGDEGAVLASPGTAQSVEELDAFVKQALVVARTLAEAAGRVPPPASMASYAPAWRAFAEASGGRFEVGGMWIHDAAFDEATLRLGTTWDDEGRPSATVIELPLPAKDDGEPRHLDAAARALVESLATQGAAVDLGPARIQAKLAAPLADPRSLEPTLLGLARLARALTGRVAQGPYR